MLLFIKGCANIYNQKELISMSEKVDLGNLICEINADLYQLGLEVGNITDPRVLNTLESRVVEMKKSLDELQSAITKHRKDTCNHGSWTYKRERRDYGNPKACGPTPYKIAKEIIEVATCDKCGGVCDKLLLREELPPMAYVWELVFYDSSDKEISEYVEEKYPDRQK
jgi:hypothetical protein